MRGDIVDAIWVDTVRLLMVRAIISESHLLKVVIDVPRR